MRLGPRRALRQNGKQPTGSQTEDESAVGRDDDRPALNQAEGQPNGIPAGMQAGADQPTADLPAAPAGHPPAGAESTSPGGPPGYSYAGAEGAGPAGPPAYRYAGAEPEGASPYEPPGYPYAGAEAEGANPGDPAAAPAGYSYSGPEGASPGGLSATAAGHPYAGAGAQDASPAEPPATSWPQDPSAGSWPTEQPAVAEAGDRGAGPGGTGILPAVPAAGDVPAVSGGEEVPAVSHEEYVPAVSLDEAVAAASAAQAAEAPADARTAVLSGLARQLDKIGLRRRAGLLWDRGVVTPWQRTVGRLGISRLWQPGPGVREAADPGARALALVTVLPVILLVAWLVPGLVLLLAHAFLPAPMVLIAVPLAVALTILVARELPGRWAAPSSAARGGPARPGGAAAPGSVVSPGGTAAPGSAVSPGVTATSGSTATTDSAATPVGAVNPGVTAASGNAATTDSAATPVGAVSPGVTAASGNAATTDSAASPAGAATPGTGAQGRHARSRSRAWAAWWGLAGTLVIAAVFAIWQLAENSPQFIVSRDPGAYAQIAYWIADHGSLPIPAVTGAFGGTHPGLTFGSFGFTSHGASIVPGLTAGLPIVLAVGMWAHGVTGATVISPLIGALAILAVGGLTARLAGPQWAPAGALLLALTVPEIYTSRSAFDQTLAQALLFGGLCLVVDSFFSRRRITLASLGGVTLGLTVLAGASYLMLVLPLIVVGGALLAGRRPQAIPMAAGWLAGVILGLAGGFGLDGPALSTTTPSFMIIGILAGGLAVLTALGAAVALVAPARRRTRTLLAVRPLRWLPDAGAALVVLAGIGLAIRPVLQKVHGPASPYVSALQRLEGLPVDPGRLYAENSLYWVIWYLGVPALLLGLIGLAMVTRMCLRALLTWRDPEGTARSWAVPAAILGWGLFAVLWQPGTVPDQPWASRQLVPVVLPGLIVLGVWVAAWMIGRAHARDAGRPAVALATACFVVAMGVPPAAITFGVALSRPRDPATRLALSGLAFRPTGAGEVSAVEQLCGGIPPHSSALLLDKAAARAFAEVIRGTCGVPTGIVAGASPAEVAAVIGGIERAGRHPALLATSAAELSRYGAQARVVVNLATQQDEHLLTRPPTSTWPVRYELWLATPGGTTLGA